MTRRTPVRSASTPAIRAVALSAASLAMLAYAAPAQALPAPAAAPNITVTNENDTGPGSLRDAVELANTTAGPQTIGFAATVNTIALDRPLLSTDALTVNGASANGAPVTLRASDAWEVPAGDPGGPRAPDVLLHAQRSSLALAGLTLDAAQTALTAVFVESPSDRDSVNIVDTAMLDATDGALVVAGAQAPITLQGVALEQHDPGNRAIGIIGEDSASAAFAVSESSITGFGGAAATFQEWNRPDDATEQIRFDRTTFSGNGRIEDPIRSAGGIELQQSSNIPETPRLVVADSVLEGNAGYTAGGIAVSSPSWDTSPATRVVEITGTTFRDNLGYQAEDLSELPQPSRAAADAADAAPSAEGESGLAELPTTFDVANSTFASTGETPSRVLNIENAGTRSNFSHVTVLGGYVSVAYWINSPVLDIRDSVIDSGEMSPVDQPQPARAVQQRAEASPIAFSQRSAYVDAYDSGLPLISGVDDLIVHTADEFRLGTLADNGGPTPTALPGAGSPLIDAGEAGAGLLPDQRGVTRPQGPRADIGAVEVEVDGSTESGTESSTDPGTDPATEPATDPGTEPATDPGTEPAADPGTDPGADPATDLATDPATDPTTDPSSDATTEPGTDSTPSGQALAQTGAAPGWFAWGVAAALVAALGAALLTRGARARRS